MLYLTILVPKFWQETMVEKYAKGWGGTWGNTPGMDILNAGEGIVPKLDMGCDGGSLGEGGTPVAHTYQQKNMYICPSALVGVVPVR